MVEQAVQANGEEAVQINSYCNEVVLRKDKKKYCLLKTTGEDPKTKHWGSCDIKNCPRGMGAVQTSGFCSQVVLRKDKKKYCLLKTTGEDPKTKHWGSCDIKNCPLGKKE